MPVIKAASPDQLNEKLGKTTITGTIQDVIGYPFPGTYVRVKGTKITTTADVNGNFTIKTKKSDELLIFYLGYEQKTVEIKNSLNLQITLKEDNQMMLGEVIFVKKQSFFKRLFK